MTEPKPLRGAGLSETRDFVLHMVEQGEMAPDKRYIHAAPAREALSKSQRRHAFLGGASNPQGRGQIDREVWPGWMPPRNVGAMICSRLHLQTETGRGAEQMRVPWAIESRSREAT